MKRHQCSILFYSRLCPSSAGSSPVPESSNIFCPLLFSEVPALVCLNSDCSLPWRVDLQPVPFSAPQGFLHGSDAVVPQSLLDQKVPQAS